MLRRGRDDNEPDANNDSAVILVNICHDNDGKHRAMCEIQNGKKGNIKKKDSSS
jgi:hypothetical protein